MLNKFLKWSLAIAILCAIGFGCFYEFYFLRKPNRTPPNHPSLFVSPANGVVASVTHWNEDSLVITKGNWGAINVLANDLGKRGTMVCITMDLSNVHYQRAPIKGTYLTSIYTSGAFHNALKHENHYGMRFENEHNVMVFQTQKGTVYKVVQIAGFAARRIVDEMKAKPGQPVEQGQVVGLIKLGSQVTLLFPENVQVTAKKGDILIDGETVVANEF